MIKIFLEIQVEDFALKFTRYFKIICFNFFEFITFTKCIEPKCINNDPSPSIQTILLFYETDAQNDGRLYR